MGKEILDFVGMCVSSRNGEDVSEIYRIYAIDIDACSIYPYPYLPHW